MQPSTSSSQLVLGFLTAYVPEELFHAASFTPVFLFHTAEDRGFARTHLPGFTCWVAGSALDRALSGELDGLAGMALASTCDTMQGLTDLWQRNVPHIPLFHFGMVQRLDGPAARAYLVAELESLRERVQAQTGRPISDAALRDSIVFYNRTRAQVRQLYAHAADFNPSDLYAYVRAVLTSAPPSVLSVVEGPPAPLLLLVGPALADPILFDVIADAGARVCGDLLDLGERYFSVDAAEDGDPLAALADRLLALIPTPTKYHSRRTRAAHLLSLVKERGAQGVIFARLLVELEQASQTGQLRTRVEAFVEMLTR